MFGDSDEQVVILEGGMGSMLQSRGVPATYCPVLCNLEMPDLIKSIHVAYREAGADAAIANTFGATYPKLAEYGLEDRLDQINRAGVRLARESGARYVFGDIGPCGLVMAPVGTATFDEVYDYYAAQARVLLEEAPDALFIETMIDIADARCALIAAKDAVAASSYPETPVFVSCTFSEQGRMELSGTSPDVAAIILTALGANGIGINCGVGPETMVAWVSQMAAVTSLPLLVQPNAGIPFLDEAGHTVFPGTVDEMVDATQRYVAAGARFIGSCCGTTPLFTQAIAEAVAALPVGARTPIHPDALVLASPRSAVALGSTEPARIIGERINPTGKKDLAAELRADTMSLVRRFAQEQSSAGADLLDINVGAPDVDEAVVIVHAIQAVQALTAAPLVIDTVDPVALEAALKAYPGRALVNSVNGSAVSMQQVLPLVCRYGAAVLVLALDDQGVPADTASRLSIVERVRAAAHEAGLADTDLAVDMLTMTAAADTQAPEVTLEGTRAAAALGLATVLGVSNVSHGLPERPLLNAAFLSAALAGGLSAALINPNSALVADAIRVYNTARATVDYQKAHADWKKALTYAQDRASAQVRALAKDTAPEEAAQESPEVALRAAILCGDAQAVSALVEAVIMAGRTPTSCIEEVLTPALNELGDAFNRGEAFLPQLMTAGDAMKAAVAQCKTHIASAADAGESGTIVFCTVKGDVHSIGKDICIALLESQGYQVIDLGVDVAAERVLEVARDRQARCVCLSALMTTTLGSMKETVAMIHEGLPSVPVMVGGAVVTPEWAASIDAGYSDDALQCVEAVRTAFAL
jgi:5-methyltetrahydrofolate--homocysteine methyltransferase